MHEHVLLLVVASVISIVVSTVAMWTALGAYPASRRLLSLIFPVGQMGIVLFSAVAAVRSSASTPYLVFIALGGFACAACNPALYRGLARAEERDAEAMRAQLVERELAEQKVRLERAREVAGDADRIRGELQELFSRVGDALAAGDTGRARQLLGNVTNIVPSVGTSYCRNLAVDALFASKAALCADSDIALNIHADIPFALDIPDVEVCALLSNLIDNAVNAVEGFERERRRIDVSTRAAQGYLAMVVSNPVDHAPDAERERARRSAHAFSDDARLREHGWGTSIVESLAKLHGGTVSTECVQGIYTVRVLLKLGSGAVSPAGARG